MARPPRSPYTPEDRQRALTALYASGDEVDGEWVPNFFAVSKVAGMPHHNTLSKWWNERDRAADSQHLAAAQRAREQAMQAGGEDFYAHAMQRIRGAVSFILQPEHQADVGPGMEKMGLHQYSRAIKDAAGTVKEWRLMMAPLQQPAEPTSSPEEDEAAALALLTRSPHILARALAALPPEAQEAVITRAQQEE